MDGLLIMRFYMKCVHKIIIKYEPNQILALKTIMHSQLGSK